MSDNKTMTATPECAQSPQASASTNSAIRASSTVVDGISQENRAESSDSDAARSDTPIPEFIERTHQRTGELIRRPVYATCPTFDAPRAANRTDGVRDNSRHAHRPACIRTPRQKRMSEPIYTYCPYCDHRIIPGQAVTGVDHEDPFRSLWHARCHEMWKSDERLAASMAGHQLTAPPASEPSE